MNIGLYQSAASISALERWQDTVSQNISNGQVVGFKKRTIEFSGQSAGKIQTNPTDRLDLDEGSMTVFPKATFGISFQPGESSPTGGSLDVAIQSEGFFQLKMPNGTHAYTRAGGFQLRSDRTLVGAGGREVLTDSGNPIQFLPQGGEVTITPDGRILQNNTQIAKIGIFRFSDTSRLAPSGGGLFTADGMEPQVIEKPDLLQGHLEQSNIMPLREMVDLVTISRAYEANQKMITSRDETMQKTLDALG